MWIQKAISYVMKSIWSEDHTKSECPDDLNYLMEAADCETDNMIYPFWTAVWVRRILSLKPISSKYSRLNHQSLKSEKSWRTIKLIQKNLQWKVQEISQLRGPQWCANESNKCEWVNGKEARGGEWNGWKIIWTLQVNILIKSGCWVIKVASRLWYLY